MLSSAHGASCAAVECLPTGARTSPPISASDLTEALSLGRSPEQGLGGDPAAVAREWARASGLNGTPVRYGAVVAAVVLPLGCAAFFGYFIVGGGPPVGLPYYAVAPLEGDLPLGVGLAVLSVLGMLGFMAALSSAAVVLGALGDDRTAECVQSLALLLPVGCLLAIPAAMLAAFVTGYHTDVVALGVDVIAAVVPIVAAAILSRRRCLGLNGP